MSETKQRAAWPPSLDVRGLLATRDLQACLMALGRYSGKLDGVAGPDTTAAVVEYQRAERAWRTGRWRTDGSVGPILCAALLADASSRRRPDGY